MNILVAVTGGIAAYKSAELVRLFVKAGMDVQVLMTEAAQAFITPLTLQALSGRAVRTSLLDESAELGMGHIELAKWAEHVVIAPASADSLARVSQGMANDLLTTVLLAYQGNVTIAPAMNQAMWLNPLTQKNVSNLREHFPHWNWVGPDSGDQACGDIGPGRMVDPQEIYQSVVSNPLKGLSGKRVMITAGPTLERLDPVRYLSNFSSGKMGYALAQAAKSAGADVVLVSGPVSLSAPAGVVSVPVESAQQMYEAVIDGINGIDLFIATAAVADFKPETAADKKIKKIGQHQDMSLTLIQNPDIVATVAGMTKDRPFVVGFAAETNDVLTYGAEKRAKKGLDMIVVNDVSNPDIGFGSDNNQVVLIDGKQHRLFGPEPKNRVADWLIKQISEQL